MSDTQQMPEACPFCGATLWAYVNDMAVFSCGQEMGMRSEGCLQNEIANLTRDLTAARARIKRLEAAGDALIGVLRDTEDQDFCDWVDKARDAETAWTAAKEATP
jgi:hypothetical protein